LKAFEYVSVQNIDEAITWLAQNGAAACVLAGGTDLLVQLRESRRAADVVIDIKQIPEVNELIFDPVSGLSIGAGVSCMRIWQDPDVVQHYPGLVDAAELIGGIQIQGRATFGGNLANASPAADSVPALIVHEAVCVIAGPNGIREMPVEDFCIGPGRNALHTGEFLVRLQMKPPKPGFGSHYLRFIPRNEMDIAVVGVGASVVLDATGQTFTAARVALGAVAPTPLLVPEAGDSLRGQPVTDEAIERAAQIAVEAAQPIADIRGTVAQRKHLAGVLTRRALNKAVERARA
jgi:carbon-monoxide dehydrogenase medium subunit